MDEYVCHYVTGPMKEARAIYHAPNLATAMAAHNSALPEFADKVLKWVGPSGIRFLFHDSKLKVGA